MKVESVKPPAQFTPVVITLETQAEVDALFAYFAHGPVSAAGLDGAFGSNAYEKLKPFSTFKYRETLDRLSRICGGAK